RSGRPLIAPLLIRRPPLAPPFPYTTLFRSHVPITTTADVRFQAGGAEIHMAAGECWIFDTWARHRVINNADSTRIHLVADTVGRSEEHTSELQSRENLVCRLLLEKKKKRSN